MTRQTLYCISGLGADEKIFSHLELEGIELNHLPWLRPERNESIEHYARRMAAGIREEQPVLLGVSFGGMVSIEIAKLLSIRKLILVSSIRHVKELPAWMRVAGQLRLNRILPIRSYKITEPIDNRRLGVTTEEERKLVREYRRNADPVYLQWAVNAVLNWRNTWTPEDTVHIHGDNDRIFPVRRLRPEHVIKGGTHLMIINRASEISRVLQQELAQLPSRARP